MINQHAAIPTPQVTRLSGLVQREREGERGREMGGRSEDGGRQGRRTEQQSVSAGCCCPRSILGSAQSGK